VIRDNASSTLKRPSRPFLELKANRMRVQEENSPEAVAGRENQGPKSNSFVASTTCSLQRRGQWG
jgi:hypothetical protein